MKIRLMTMTRLKNYPDLSFDNENNVASPHWNGKYYQGPNHYNGMIVTFEQLNLSDRNVTWVKLGFNKLTILKYVEEITDE